VCADVEVTPEVRVDAALLLVPRDAAMCDRTAAQLHGLPVPDDGWTHLAISPHSDRPRLSGIRVHRLLDSTNEVTTVRGRRVTTLPATFLALAATLTLVDLVVLGDAMVRRGMVSPERLVEAAWVGHGRGVRLGRRAAALVRPRVDSPMETRLRLLLVLAGLPEPETNRAAYSRTGRWLARPDLLYCGQRIAVEYDGRHHRDRVEQYEADLPRRERMDRAGWHVIVVTAAQLRDPRGVALRVASALRERGEPAVAALFTSEWRDLFPGGSRGSR